MTLPSVSVIIPVYNSMPYLRESLNSIASQTLQNIEIILVDDGSTDGSTKVLDEYAEKDKRIIVLTSKHEGAGAARNKGLAKAKGEYLAFLDSDDFFSFQMLEKAWGHAKSHNADIVLFNYGILLEAGIKEHCYGLLSGPCSENKNLAGALSSIDITGPEVWNKIFRRDFILRHGITFQNLKTCNDIFFVRAAFVVASSIFFLNEELITWRKNPHSLSSKRYLNAENIIDAGKQINNFIKSNVKTTNFDKFYVMIFRHIMYEYEQFPKDISTKSFVEKAVNFLPLQYRWKFFKKRVHRTMKRFKLILSSD